MAGWWHRLPGATAKELVGLAGWVDKVAEDVAEDVAVTARSEHLVADLERTVGELAAAALDRKRA